MQTSQNDVILKQKAHNTSHQTKTKQNKKQKRNSTATKHKQYQGT